MEETKYDFIKMPEAPSLSIQQQQQQQQQQLLHQIPIPVNHHPQHPATLQACAGMQLQHLVMPPQAALMPTPSSSPWNLDSMPWTLATTSLQQPGGIMRFKAFQPPVRPLQHKRKSDLSDVEHKPKQFISEEKITAHFSGLHIGDFAQNVATVTASTSNSISNSAAEYGGFSPTQCNEEMITAATITDTDNATNLEYRINARELEEKLRNANRITVCEELKQLHAAQKKANFLPEALLMHIETPSKALVLWHPTPLTELLQQNDEVKTESVGTNRTTMAIDDAAAEDKNGVATSVAPNVIFVGDQQHHNLMFNENNDRDADLEIDDFIDNNNTCSVDFNNLQVDEMDEDL